MKLLRKIGGILVILLILCARAQVVFALNPPDGAHSSVTATSAPADGSSQSQITVTLKDSSGTPLTGDTVAVSAPGDPSAVIYSGSPVLDGFGKAIFTMTSTNAGTHELTVTDTTAVATLSALGLVTFDSLSSPVDHNASNTPACSDATPVGAPDLYQVTPKDTSTRLYFAPPDTKYTGFLVSYGLTSGADSYSVHFDQVRSSGAISYTVGSLAAKTPYYFKVRAVNGCAYGPWSQTVASLNVSNIKKLPETGPSQLVLLGGLGSVVALIGAMMIFVL